MSMPPPPHSGYPIPHPGRPDPYMWRPPISHSQATTAFTLSIIGFMLCVFCSPVAWYMGYRAGKDMDAQPGVFWSNRDHAKIGMILGMVGTLFYGSLLALWMGLTVLSVAAGA